MIPTDTPRAGDPAHTGTIVTDYDLYLFGEGNHTRIYDKLGAHPVTMNGTGWAPSLS